MWIIIVFLCSRALIGICLFFNDWVLLLTHCTCGCLITMQFLFCCFTPGNHTMSSCLMRIPVFSQTHTTTRVFVTRGEGVFMLKTLRASNPYCWSKRISIPLEITWWVGVVWTCSQTKIQHELVACHQIWGWVFILKILMVFKLNTPSLSKKHICFLEDFTMSLCLEPQLMLFFCKTTATQTCFVDQRWGGGIDIEGP